mmetsp:Transcript_9469/g.28245  ORF Transcript_9469/g.28245 Transcript_9469/m.28245 type:complete len:134 (-) Transcript_9469:2071-2472(-)
MFTWFGVCLNRACTRQRPHPYMLRDRNRPSLPCITLHSTSRDSSRRRVELVVDEWIEFNLLEHFDVDPNSDCMQFSSIQCPASPSKCTKRSKPSKISCHFNVMLQFCPIVFGTKQKECFQCKFSVKIYHVCPP